MSEKPTKTFIVNEHHECFFIWNYALKHKMMPAAGNTLFHVDEHADMGTPTCNSSLDTLNGNLLDYLKFGMRELNIANFLASAIYLRLFKKIFWIKQEHKVEKVDPERKYVRSFNDGGKQLIIGEYKSLLEVLSRPKIKQLNVREFDYYEVTLDHLPQEKNVILDIDLDYFSCTEKPAHTKELYLEITKAEYQRFLKDNYHRLNFMVERVEVTRKSNRYYYVLNRFDALYPEKLKVDQKTILLRIDRFVEKLRSLDIRPSIIDICRSRFSGYTPADQWRFIEQKVLRGLRSLYSVEVVSPTLEKEVI